MRITKVTTRNGDSGKTNLAKGEQVLKSDDIIHALGAVSYTHLTLPTIYSV